MTRKTLIENEFHEDHSFPLEICKYAIKTNHAIPSHFHPSFEVIYVNSGSAIINIGNERYYASAPCIFFVNMYQIHSVEPAASERACMLHCIVFDKVILDTINLNRYYLNFIKPIVDGEIIFPTRIASDNKLCKILTSSLHTVIKEYCNKNIAYELLITLELERLIASMFRYHEFYKDNEAKRISSSQKELMELLMLYMKENFQRKISLDEISDFLHINKFHFCRLIHNITGKSFTELLNIHRIGHAEKLIKSKSLSIYCIAEQSGFTNLSYFNRMFMKYTGRTPSDFRRNMQDALPPTSDEICRTCSTPLSMNRRQDVV